MYLLEIQIYIPFLVTKPNCYSNRAKINTKSVYSLLVRTINYSMKVRQTFNRLIPS